MKSVVCLVLCCIASTASAQTAVDSGTCPWKLPFNLNVSGTGLRHNFGGDVPTHGQGTHWDSGYAPYSTSLNIVIDSALIKANPPYLTKVSGSYSLQTHTLRYALSYDNMGVKFTDSATIVFARGRDSIVSIVADKNTQHPDSITYPGYSRKENWHFEIRGLTFTDSSIFTDDSSITYHSLLMSYSSVENFNPEGIPGFGSFNSSYFSASSVDLSGIFRPRHFSDQTSAVLTTPISKTLQITQSSDRLLCSFSNSPEARALEVYSLVGVKIATTSILPGETQATLPILPNGFYFIRLGNDIQKVNLAN